MQRQQSNSRREGIFFKEEPPAGEDSRKELTGTADQNGKRVETCKRSKINQQDITDRGGHLSMVRHRVLPGEITVRGKIKEKKVLRKDVSNEWNECDLGVDGN